MENFSITMLVPVLNRPKNVECLVTSFLETVPAGRADMLFITGEDCPEEIAEISKFKGPISIAIAPPDVVSWAKRINWGVNYSATNHHLNSPAPWLLCGADDVKFHPNWFERAEAIAENFDGIIGTNDLGNPATIGGWHSTHPIVSRKYIMEQGTMDQSGVLCHEGYHHNYVDVEFVHTAMKRGAWKHDATCIIEHLHPAWSKSTWDDVYSKGYVTSSTDAQLWLKRKAAFQL